jgi:hypothetical protein
MANDDELIRERAMSRPAAGERIVEPPMAQDRSIDDRLPPGERVVDQPVGRTSRRTVEHVVEEPVVREVYPSTAVADRTVTRTTAVFSISQFLHGLCGFVLVLFGAVAVVRGGFTGDVATHTFQVMGITHTTVIGLFEIAFGLLLIAAALTPGGRPFGGFIGAVLIVAGVVFIGATQQTLNDAHTSHGLGWLALILGVISLIAAFLPVTSTYRRRDVTVR